MDAAEALRDMAAVALFVAALAVVWVEPVRERRADRRYAEQLREFKLAADARTAVMRADLERTRALNDCAFEAAEQQLAQSGRCSQMPSREQVIAAAGEGAHDWLGVSPQDRALEVALLEAVFHHEARPPVAADTDPDAAASW
jgi:hypothetical protein